MYPYSTSTKNKSLKANKVPPELIQHFKNTAELPRRSLKENEYPKQPILYPQTKPTIKVEPPTEKSTQVNKSKVVQCDISHIADSYVLEGNVLRKHETYDQVMKKQRKKENTVDKQNSQTIPLIDRKQIIKLQYLEKMGFLRPDQKQFLAQYRKTHPEKTQNEPNRKQELPLNPKGYNMFVQGMENMPFYSPTKTIDPKMLGHYFSPAPKMSYPIHYGY